MTVTVCVPVWNGGRFVGETLECVRAQTLPGIRVLVSVDASDDDSGAVCRAFGSDPRFEVTIQPERMGWIENVNWLLRRVATPFGCLLPHDDLIEPDYLKRLVARLENRPSAVLAYPDIETFGVVGRSIVQPEVVGDRLDRIVTFLLAPGGGCAFRGVFRRRVLERGHYLRHDADGYGADFLWLLALAGEGDLLREPDAVYRKRMHDESETARLRSQSRPAKAGIWVDHCVACHEVAMAAADWSVPERQAIAAAAMARVTGLCEVTVLGGNPANPVALVALASHYCLRVAGELAAGSVPLAGRALPLRLRKQVPRRFAAMDRRPAVEAGREAEPTATPTPVSADAEAARGRPPRSA